MTPRAIPPAPAPEPARLETPRRVDSGALLQGEREVVIVHRGQEYRLRVTRAEKLLLTK